MVTGPNRLAYRADCIGLVGALGVASLPGHIPKMGEWSCWLRFVVNWVLLLHLGSYSSIYKTLFWSVSK